MSSGQAIPFTRQYNSFRVTAPERGSNSRSSLSSKHKVVLRSAPKLDELPVAVEKSPAVLTPRLSRRTNGAHLANSHTIASKLKIESSPLRSPQIIRSTRMTNGVNKVAATAGTVQHVKGCSLHSKSPGSSGTSVESIVPKYGNNSALLNRTNNVYAANGGPQKRAYNINNTSTKASHKMINTRSSGGNCTTTAKHTAINNNNNNHHVHSLNHQHANNNTTHLNNNHNLSIIGKKSKENFTSYSSKYPNGLPFEDEFYHRRKKSLSETSSSNTLSSSESSDSRNFPFEDDEFSRKPSNEALYVDFTKPLFSHANIGGNGNAPETRQQSKKCTSASSALIANHQNHHHQQQRPPTNKIPLAEYNRRTVLSSSGTNIHHHRPEHHQLYLNNNNNAKNHGLYKENGVMGHPHGNGGAATCNGKIFSAGDRLEGGAKIATNGKPVTYVPASAWVAEPPTNGKAYRHPDAESVENEPDYDDEEEDDDEGVESDDAGLDNEYVPTYPYFFKLVFKYLTLRVPCFGS